MKKIAIIFCFMFVIGPMYAQNFIKKLGESAKNAAENSLQNNVNRTVDNSVDKAFNKDTYKKGDKPDKKKANENSDTWKCSCGHENTGKFCTECGAKQPDANGWTCSQCGANGNKGKFCTECGAKQNADDDSNENASDDKTTSLQQGSVKSLEMIYSKCDFVAGDEIIYEDNIEGEQMGEFPSKWDLLHGVVEIASLNGEAVINFVEEDSKITPLMKKSKNYLPDIFTFEFDFWVPNIVDSRSERQSMRYDVAFDNESDSDDEWNIRISDYNNGENSSIEVDWDYSSTSGSDISGKNSNISVASNSWSHFALSFNKRALKMYINGVRVANIPNATPQSWLSIENYQWGGFQGNGNMNIKNIRIAKGAVPLYDRMMTDGKFITYGITFDVGKSVIKPESMGEISRIVTLMTENLNLKFSVEGHTDNTGNAVSNQTLSEARSKAIVDKLVELGIAQDRLSSLGKGQTSPIADNSTDEGRAKNRRVEFVKK